MGVPSYHNEARERGIQHMARARGRSEHAASSRPRGPPSARRAASSTANRPARRFSACQSAIKDEALAKLSDWAAATFGSLDAAFRERHAFELRIFKF